MKILRESNVSETSLTLECIEDAAVATVTDPHDSDSFIDLGLFAVREHNSFPVCLAMLVVHSFSLPLSTESVSEAVRSSLVPIPVVFSYQRI